MDNPTKKPTSYPATLEDFREEADALKADLERRQAEFDAYRRDARIGIRRYEAVVEAARNLLYRDARRDMAIYDDLRAALAALEGNRE